MGTCPSVVRGIAWPTATHVKGLTHVTATKFAIVYPLRGAVDGALHFPWVSVASLALFPYAAPRPGVRSAVQLPIETHDTALNVRWLGERGNNLAVPHTPAVSRMRSAP